MDQKNTNYKTSAENLLDDSQGNPDHKELLKELHEKYDIELDDLKKLELSNSPDRNFIFLQLLRSGIIATEKLNKISTKQYGLNTVSTAQIDLDELPFKYANLELLEKYSAAPIYIKDGVLFIAIDNPNDFTSLTSYQFHTGISTQAILVTSQDLTKIKKNLKGLITNQDLNTIGSDNNQIDANDPNNNPLIKYVDKIISEALKKGASDIHFEPYQDKYRIRFRNDGILSEIANLSSDNANKINSRLKVMANLDISEKRIPQDGRFEFTLDNKSYDFRMSTCPTLFGEKIVIRILDPSKAKLGIDQLGFEEEQKELFLKALQKQQGIILVTGPTGSGKTISLYTALNILNTKSRNISTAEDPIEIYLPGINQVQINSKIKLTFASALRCFLRQDPDVMMVGEIRDLETAEIAIKAAQTGHLVLSTLHTNSAAETLTRLMNMGLPVYNMATAVSMIIAQRLIRCLCNNCKIIEKLPQDVLIKENFPQEIIDQNIEIYNANPNCCDQCVNGYIGRVGIYETMLLSKQMQRIILSGGSSLDIKKQAKEEKILSLRQAGLRKVIKGITSLTEVNRVTKNA